MTYLVKGYGEEVVIGTLCHAADVVQVECEYLWCVIPGEVCDAKDTADAIHPIEFYVDVGVYVMAALNGYVDDVLPLCKCVVKVAQYVGCVEVVRDGEGVPGDGVFVFMCSYLVY